MVPLSFYSAHFSDALFKVFCEWVENEKFGFQEKKYQVGIDLFINPVNNTQ
jgi:hypothetical protein